MADATQSLPGGITATYSLTGENGTLYVQVYDSTGRILAADSASYANRNEIVIQITGQIANELKDVRSEISTVQGQINQLNAVINNPSTNPQDKAFAEKSLVQARNQLSVLQEQEDSLYRANLQIGSEFSSITLKLNKLAAEPTTAPPATPTVSNTGTSTPTATSTNNANNLTGAASDDSGAAPTSPGAAQTSTGSTNTAAANTVATDTADVDINALDTEAAEEGDSAGELGEPGSPKYDNEGFIRSATNFNAKPGKRMKNPLGDLASYTYQLSLYMVSPKAYEVFSLSGRKNIYAGNTGNPEAGGIYLIAQSAGMGSPANRAPGFDLDYYIDNLTFKSFISAKETSAPVANTEYRFKIVEPYGFSFVTKLKRAQDSLVSNSGGSAKHIKGGNPTKMFYILGIRFFGWDQTGSVITGNEQYGDYPIDPNADGSGALFETFYDIVITEFKFKIDGNATTYDIKASTASISSTINATKGMVPDTKELSGTSVRDFISGPTGLLTTLNNEQQTLLKNKKIEYPITYRVQWLGDDAETIALSKLNTPNKTQKSNQAGSNAKTTTQSNDANAVKAAPNKNKVTYKAKGNSPITQEIEQIISQSSYLTDAMTKNYKDDNENNPKTKEAGSVKGANKPLTWFNISPNITNIRWDTIRKDWAYDITYVIQTYLIPQVESPYVANKTKYYGPHKRYEYWYTGQNTEVLSYEQKIDNQYFLAVLDDAGDKKDGNKNTSDSKTQGGKNAVNTTPGGDKSGSGGTNSLAAVNSFRTSLYDPASFAEARIQILGDPDFLLHDSQSIRSSKSNSYSKFYEQDGFKPNATGGQVFVEIDFKEAIDYSRDGSVAADEEGLPPVESWPGTLSINDSIEFWRYPEDVQSEIRGISYQIKSINNSFQNGAFKQTLDLIINQDVADDAASEEAKQQAEEEEKANSEITGTPEDATATDSNSIATGTPATNNPDNAG